MPWCPECKVEYQDGFTVCSDCKVELVESLEVEEAYVPFIQTEDKKVADKLVRYFKYSDLDSTFLLNEETQYYIVSIPPNQITQAKKLYQAFYYVERDLMEQGGKDLTTPSSDDEAFSSEETSKDLDYSSEDDLSSEDDYEVDVEGDPSSDLDAEERSSVYVMKADQYKDLTGTVGIFLFFGIVGLIVVLLNIGGVLSFFNGWIPNVVMGALFLFFIYIAMSTNQKAKLIQAEIETENKLTKEINAWLEQNVTESFLESLHDDNISNELNYIIVTDTMKEMLIKEFGVQNLAYLDRMIEEYYSNTFDQE